MNGTLAATRVGSVVGGKYRLVRLLGEGGMGEVYEAQHLVVGRRFAVKFLHRHLAQHRDALARFRREAQAAGALENEHIASVLDLDTAEDGAPFLVMEYLLGESVAELLRREGPLPLTRAVAIVLQVCRGLEAAHASGIVHRDLKPDNLFSLRRADGSELIKILDFGIAKLVHDDTSPALTQSGAMVGTPFYMAPEQARGDKQLDARVDIYALGVILYELLSGHKPHPGDSHNAILAHILTEAVVPLEQLRPGLPAGVVTVVEHAMFPSRAARPSSVAELARALLPFAGREVVPVQSQFDLRALAAAKTLPTPDSHALALPARVAAVAPPARPRRTAAIIAPTLVVAVAAGVAAWSLTQRSRAPAEPQGVAATAPGASHVTAQAVAPPVSAMPSSATPPSAMPPSASASASGSASVGRLPGRPKVTAKSVPSSSTSAHKQLESLDNPKPTKPSTGVDFDTQNPYQ